MSDKKFKQMEATIAQLQHQLSDHQSKEAALQETLADLKEIVTEHKAQAKQYCFTIAMLRQGREREKQAAQVRHVAALEQHQSYKTRTESQVSQLSELVAWNEFTRKAIEEKSTEQGDKNMALKNANDLLRQKAATYKEAELRRTQENLESNKHYIAKHVALVNEHEALKANAVLQAAEINKLHDRIAREIDQNAEGVQEKLALERSMDKTEQRHAKEIKFLENESKALRSERDHFNEYIKHMGESSHTAVLAMESEMRSVKTSHKAEIDRLEKALEDERAKKIHLEAAVSSLRRDNQLLKQDFASLKQESAAVKTKGKCDSDSEALTGLWAKQPNLSNRVSTDLPHGRPLTKEHLQEQNRQHQDGTRPISNSIEAFPKQTISPKAMIQKIASLEAQLRAYIVTNILLNSSLKDLTEDNKALTEDNKVLKADYKVLSEDYEALIEYIRPYIKDNKSLSEENETLTEENRAVNKDHNALFLDNVAQNRKINEQARLLDSTLRQNEKHELDKKEHSKYCHLIKQEKALIELNQIHRELKDVKYERDVLQMQHKALTTERKILTTEHAALTTSYEALQLAHNALKFEHSKLTAQFADSKTSYATLHTAHCDLNLKHKENITRHQDLQKQHHSLEWRFDEKQRELDWWKTTHGALQNTYKVLEAEQHELRDELDGLLGEHRKLQPTQKSLLAEHETLKTSDTELADMYSDLVEQHRDLTARDMELDVKYWSLEGRFEELLSECSELESGREEDAGIIKGLRGELRLVKEGMEEGWDVVEAEVEEVREEEEEEVVGEDPVAEESDLSKEWDVLEESDTTKDSDPWEEAVTESVPWEDVVATEQSDATIDWSAEEYVQAAWE